MPTQNNNSKKGQEQNNTRKAGKEATQKGAKGNSSQGKNVLDMNLAEGEIIHYFSWKRATFTLIGSILLVIIIIWGAYWGLSWWGGKKTEENELFNKKIEELKSQIESSKQEATSLFIFKKKLALANELMDDHIYWTNFFNYLEDNTLEDIHYTGFNGSINGEYSLPVMTEDYSIINSQVKQMREDDVIKEVEVRRAAQAGAEAQEGEVAGSIVDFNMDITLDKELFTQ